MEDAKNPLRFVHLNKPGQKYEAEEHKALRTHVRHAIVREKKARHVNENIRIFTPSNWPGRKTRKKRNSLNSLPSTESEIDDETITASPQHCKKPPDPSTPRKQPMLLMESSDALSDIGVDHKASFPAPDGPTAGPTVYHPLATCAANFVDLPQLRLNELFKSSALRTVSEPCFDAKQIDATRSLDVVFPTASSDALFMHCLVLSILQFAGDAGSDDEKLKIEKRTIQLLSLAIVEDSSPPSISLIGAIMTLAAAAYRSNDHKIHDIHIKGLQQAMSLVSDNPDTRISPSLIKAVFWLDLISSILMDSRRMFSHLSLPMNPCWRRESATEKEAFGELPMGFRRHQALIPDDMLECLIDIVDLQARMKDPAHRQDFILLDDMQASIESRLVFQKRACSYFGPIAEMVRLAAFICCYCSWTDTWASDVIPVKIAEKLLGCIQQTLVNVQAADDAWMGRQDLVLWMVFVCASLTKNDSVGAKSLKGRMAVLMYKLRAVNVLHAGARWSTQKTVKATLEEFIHCGRWLSDRMLIRDWFALEMCIDAEHARSIDQAASHVGPTRLMAADDGFL